MTPAVATSATTVRTTSARRPRYSDLTMRAFELFFRPWRARRLITRIVDVPRTLPDDAPLILVANHTSWWDGFLLRDLHRMLRPGSSLFSVMTARELDRNPFLRRIGAVPLDPRSPGSLLAALRVLQEIARTEPAVTVSWFPQGRIAPAWQRPLGFQRGIELLARALQPCWVLPVGIHIEPLNRTRPTAFISAGSPVRVDGGRLRSREMESLVIDRLDRIADIVIEDADPRADREDYA